MYLTAGWPQVYPWTDPAPTNHNPLQVAQHHRTRIPIASRHYGGEIRPSPTLYLQKKFFNL